MKRFLSFLAVLGLVVVFQNCQKAHYGSTGDSSLAEKAGALTAVTSEDPEDNATDLINVVDSGSSSAPLPPVVAPPRDPSDSDVADADDGAADDGAADDASDDGGDGNVCILAGPGKSVKLGITPEGVMHGQNPIPQVLCMSANACLNIASKVFDVKGPEFRGYCKLPHGNPHVSHITDAQLLVKVNALLAAP